MHLYFLLAAVLSTVILGSPVAEAQLPSIDDLSSYVPQGLAPNPNQEFYADALPPQTSNSQTFQDFAAPNQPIGPNPVFDIALAPNSPGEQIDAETAQYRSFDCHAGYSVCCQGKDSSINSQHMPCSESKSIPILPSPSLNRRAEIISVSQRTSTNMQDLKMSAPQRTCVTGNTATVHFTRRHAIVAYGGCFR